LLLLATEQYPVGLGKTIKGLRDLLGESQEYIEKMSFSCYGEPRFREKLGGFKKEGRIDIILTGIEAHVCVLQTATDLIEDGFNVFIPKDATASRKDVDLDAGLHLMDRLGCTITTTETLVFQLLKKAGTEDFRFMSKLMK